MCGMCSGTWADLSGESCCYDDCWRPCSASVLHDVLFRLQSVVVTCDLLHSCACGGNFAWWLQDGVNSFSPQQRVASMFMVLQCTFACMHWKELGSYVRGADKAHAGHRIEVCVHD